MATTKIAEQLDIAPSSLSFHMKELTHAKLITSRSEVRFVIYSADIAVMNGLISIYRCKNCEKELRELR